MKKIQFSNLKVFTCGGKWENNLQNLKKFSLTESLEEYWEELENPMRIFLEKKSRKDYRKMLPGNINYLKLLQQELLGESLE